jgi:hypothetical protein
MMFRREDGTSLYDASQRGTSPAARGTSPATKRCVDATAAVRRVVAPHTLGRKGLPEAAPRGTSAASLAARGAAAATKQCVDVTAALQRVAPHTSGRKGLPEALPKLGNLKTTGLSEEDDDVHGSGADSDKDYAAPVVSSSAGRHRRVKNKPVKRVIEDESEEELEEEMEDEEEYAASTPRKCNPWSDAEHDQFILGVKTYGWGGWAHMIKNNMIPTRNSRCSITQYAKRFKLNHPADYQRLMLTAFKCKNPNSDGRKSKKTKPITNSPIDLFSHPSHQPLTHRDKKSRVTLGLMSESDLTMTQGTQSTTKSQLRHTQSLAINLAHHYISMANTDKNFDVVMDKKWPGTVRYQDILEEYVDEYFVLVCEKKTKRILMKKQKAEILQLAKNVMERVKPGRFLTNADTKNDMRSLMDEDDILWKIVNALSKRNCNKKSKKNANEEDDTTNDYFSEARNMLTGELHKYTVVKDYFGQESKTITDEEMMNWCDQGSVQNYTLPT